MREHPDEQHGIRHRGRISKAHGPSILDLTALVLGYGFAALAARTLWPAGVTPRGPALLALFLAYAWLGLAMSGPFVLLRRPGARIDDLECGRERPLRARIGRPLSLEVEHPPLYSRAEMAWLLIGAYWILAAVLVLPTRLPASSVPVLGLLPILAALFLWAFGRRRDAHTAEPGRWTHQAALLVLATWPLAWLDIILLTASYG